MDVFTFVFLVAGGVLLVAGAESLVRGATRLAVSVGISPLVVGLTVVAFATSSPELAVSLASTLGGDADIAMGNVVGSNIFNVLVILGLTAVISPLVVNRQLVTFDVPLMIGISVVMLLFALGGEVNRVEGAVLFGGLVAYVVWSVRQSRRDSGAVELDLSGYRVTARTLVIDIALIAAGLGILVAGSELFVSGATEIAEALGVSQLVIGLTVVAAGTSLPEVATSVLAVIRGERDIAVGNVVGSNIFNILAVLGLTAIVSDSGVAAATAAQQVDIPIMTGVALILLPVIVSGYAVSRWEGALFLGYYVAYTSYLILDANGSGATDAYGLVMLGVVVPVTVLVVLARAVQSLRARRTEGTARALAPDRQ